jgi:glycosyltransferase involved in cell wall biosynthesis
MTGRPRAVFISPLAPARTGNGLAMRMGLFADALAEFAELTIVVAPVAGDAGGGESLAGAHVHVVPVAGRTETQFALLSRIRDERARLAAFRDYGKPSLAAHLSPSVLADIVDRVADRRPDIVHIGRSYLSPCVERLPPGVAATLDLDEDDRASYASQARLARARGRPFLADWLEQEGEACDQLVERWRPHFRRAFVACAEDGLRLARRHTGLTWEVARNAVPIPPRRPKRDDGATMLFVGGLGYAPNAEGVLWFCREVLPRLRSKSAPSCRLWIAGAASEAVAELARHPRVSLLGRVDSVAPLYERATLALAPLRAGGGTRVKLLEAAAHRTASVATFEASRGMDWPLDAAGWTARSPEAFASACRAALSDAVERDRRAARGYNWARRRYGRDRVVAGLARSLSQIFEETRT